MINNRSKSLIQTRILTFTEKRHPFRVISVRILWPGTSHAIRFHRLRLGPTRKVKSKYGALRADYTMGALNLPTVPFFSSRYSCTDNGIR